MEAVAAAAGVTRQTVYAHFPSRQRLLAAALDHATEEAVAAMDAVEPDRGPAGEALLRLLDASMETARRYPGLLQRVNAMPVSEREDAARHAPVTDRLRALVQRGQRDGEFDAALPPSWLVAVVISLSHASSAQVAAGHLSAAQAREALHISLLRVLAPASSRADPHRTGTGGRRR